MEKDDEVRGNDNAIEYGGRSIYDPRLGRFISVDPKWRQFPCMSSYAYAANSPIYFIDQEGEGPIKYRYYIFNETTGEPILLLERDGTDDRESNELVYEYYMARQYTSPEYGLEINFQKVQNSWITPGETMVDYLNMIGKNRMHPEGISGHDFLDIVGLVPVVGDFADGINAAWYYVEGDYVNGAFSSAAIIPVVGSTATAGKWSKKALKLLGNNTLVSKSGLVFGKAAKEYNRLSHVLLHTVNDLTKDLHGVFTVADGDLIATLDEAWDVIKSKSWDVSKSNQTIDGITRSVGKNGNVNYIYDTGKTIGFEGGKAGSGQVLTKVQITIEKGTTSNVTTAFPTK